MQSVADALGVTKMTVSLALRNHPSISVKTRARIVAHARKLGYTPNPLVSALMANLRRGRVTNAPQIIAFVTVYPEADFGIGIKRLIAGAKARASQLGYAIHVFSLADQQVSPRRLAGILTNRGIRGLVIAPFPEPEDRFVMPWERFACATIARSLKSPELHRAHSNQYHAVLLAFERVWKRGYRRIGLVAERQQSERCEHWWRNGFRLAAERHECLLRQCPSHLPHKLESDALLRWFRRAAPDAILSIDGRALAMLRKENIRVPEDVGYAMLDLLEDNPFCAGVNQNHELIAAAAVDVVIEQLYNNELGVPSNPKSVMIEGVWVDGRTLRRQA